MSNVPDETTDFVVVESADHSTTVREGVLRTNIAARGLRAPCAIPARAGKPLPRVLGDGARTRSFNLGKVTLRFCIQGCGMNPSGCLSTPTFECDHVAFASHHRPIKWSGR